MWIFPVAILTAILVMALIAVVGAVLNRLDRGKETESSESRPAAEKAQADGQTDTDFFGRMVFSFFPRLFGSKEKENELEHLGGYWLTRIVFLRSFGFIYFIAFFSLSHQLKPLIGENGLLPAKLFLERIGDANSQGLLEAFWARPTLFWFTGISDGTMLMFCYLGIVLSLLVVSGMTNAVLMALLWMLYMSLVHVGQLFYGYGWEMLLLEMGFLSIFLCPLFGRKLLPQNSPTSKAVVVLYWWCLFRVMFGAGLIKIRGDACWRDLTCMMYHYETQPIPNPFSWHLHQLPPFIHKVEVLANHFIELIVPFCLFGPRRFRIVGGLLQVFFQCLLIISGNLSFLNYLTIVCCIPCFDDRALRFFFKQDFTDRLKELLEPTKPQWLWPRRVILGCLVGMVLYLSINPTLNLLSRKQAMNRSFDRLHLVNTYGAFGSVGKIRNEVILQGTYDEVSDDDAKWIEYEFKCIPGSVERRPCVISPYHYRLDWQIWFAAMSNYQREPWLIHFAYKLLQDDEGARSLLAGNPFKNGPPKFIRAELYKYRFTKIGSKSDDWWERERVAEYFPPLNLESEGLKKFLRAHGWLKEE